jgi:methyl-accepting chemotaxis protein
MTIRRRVVMGYAGILVLVAAMVIAGALVLVPLKGAIREYSDTVVAQADAASEVALAAKAMGVNGAIGVIGSPSERAKAVSQLEVKRRGSQLALDQAVTLQDRASVDASSGDLADIDNLRTLIDQYNTSIKRALALDVTNQDGALALLAETVFPLGDKLDAAAASYYQGQQTQALVEAEHLATDADTMWIVLCTVAGIVIVGGVLLGVNVPRTVNRYLQAATSGIDSSVNQMLAIASQVAAGAAQTVAATNETTATVEEVRQTALLSQERAARLAGNSEHVARAAELGRAQAQGTIAVYARIQSQMDVIAEAVGRLFDQTQAVGEIIAAVNDLAEQSNLLAVNASIEAAKAGEDGRGFAVVAEEVKSLAAQSKQAVVHVRGILIEIESAGKTAVQAADQGRETIAAGRVEIAQAEEGTLSLADAASETAQSALQISASSLQQLAGMDQISQAIGSIRQAGNQSVEGTRQVEEEAAQLQELAMQMRRLVDTGATVSDLDLSQDSQAPSGRREPSVRRG